MNKRFFVLIVTLLTIVIGNTYAQVQTRYYRNGNTTRYKWGISLRNQEIKRMPAFDMAQLIKEDAENDVKPRPFRFGKAFDVAYTLDDGTWEEVDGGRLWSMTVTQQVCLVSILHLWEHASYMLHVLTASNMMCHSLSLTM